jgi:acetoin utilization deacetylase AcuC-like enzyme
VDVYYCDTFVLPLPDGHSFPMDKYRRLRERIVAARLPQLSLKLPTAATVEDLLAVHCPAYIERVLSGTLSEAEQRKIGFPWSAQMAERSRRVSGATMAAVQSALRDGVAANLAGGTHHAKYDSGAGYCIFNDSVVAARFAQRTLGIERVLVVDLDVHQGDGTALLTARDPTIHTFSMHAQKAFPALKPASNCDIALPDGTADDAYLALLAEALPQQLSASRAQLVIYLAGADPFKSDRLGRLGLSKSGLAQRDQMVLQSCREQGLPVAITMAGGYAHHIDDIVDIHFETIRIAAAIAHFGAHRSAN